MSALREEFQKKEKVKVKGEQAQEFIDEQGIHEMITALDLRFPTPPDPFLLRDRVKQVNHPHSRYVLTDEVIEAHEMDPEKVKWRQRDRATGICE